MYGCIHVRGLTHVLHQEDEDLMSPLARSPCGSRSSSVLLHNNSFGRTLPAAGLPDGIAHRSSSGSIPVFTRQQPPVGGQGADNSGENAIMMDHMEVVPSET